MAYTLGNMYAKNLCKWTVLLRLIIENVVTCFFETQCIIQRAALLWVLWVFAFERSFDFKIVLMFLPRDAIQARPIPSRGVRPSVCLSVCLSRSCILLKGIKISCHTILSFPYQTSWQYIDGDLLTEASNAGRVGINRDSEPISGFTACC